MLLKENRIEKAIAITPADATDIFTGANAGSSIKGLYIGVAGNVSVDILNSDGTKSTNVQFANHPVGYLNAVITRVYLTGTTATNMLGLI